MDPPEPFLSVVVPAYLVQDYLPECVESVLSDAPPRDLEVVAVDDHSPDRCGELLDGYAQRDSRVRAVHLATNVGLGRARNAGLARSAGKYVWFVDGDDWLPPGAVPAVMERLAETGPDVLVVDHAEMFPDGHGVPGTPSGALAGAGEPGPLARYPQLLTLANSACTKVVRRTFLDNIRLRFPPGWYEDSAYTHRLLLAAGRIDMLDQVCYCYRQRESGAITKSVSPHHFDVFTQYARLWATVDAANGAYEQFRPELFRLMVNHLLVIAGNDHRLPAERRREFFGRVVAEYRRRLPEGGYRPPGGFTGLKHRLVRWNAYRAYAALRLARRATGRLRTVPAPAPARQSSDLNAR